MIMTTVEEINFEGKEMIEGIDMTMIEVEIDMEEMSAAIIGEILIGMSVIQRGAVLPTQRVISVGEAKEIQSGPEMIMMPLMAEVIAEVIIPIIMVAVDIAGVGTIFTSANTAVQTLIRGHLEAHRLMKMIFF